MSKYYSGSVLFYPYLIAGTDYQDNKYPDAGYPATTDFAIDQL